MKLKFVFRSLCVAAKREEKRSHSLAYARANGVIDVIAREWMRSDIGNANDDDRDKRKMKKIDCEIIQRARASERVASGDLWSKRTRSTRLTVDAACLFASLAFAAYWLTKIHTICNKLWIWSGKIEEETEHGEREREREWEGKKLQKILCIAFAYKWFQLQMDLWSPANIWFYLFCSFIALSWTKPSAVPHTCPKRQSQIQIVCTVCEQSTKHYIYIYLSK